ncbi:MAG: reverse transcriptase family protein [Muribaculum sp.]|nr:reverse transcriptase family protein [Muribaculum sp.]
MADYLKDIIIRNRKELFDVLNFIAPIIDGWSMTEPMSGRQIMQFASARTRKTSYVDFTIPKKSGGMRKISAPVKPLKAVQSAINILLQSIFVPDEHATGFVFNRNVKDNALIHVGQTCIFNTDLENFFPSITKLMVRRALHRELGDKLPSNEVINIICRICTVPDNSGIEVLPQGAPTSPVLSNIVLKSLDKDMSKLAERMECRYSRYADDITFSHSKSIRRMSPFWQSRIYNIIAKYGLKVNEKKTRTFVPGIRQEVTGVVVSDKINVPRSYVKQLRVLMHLWEKYGYAQAQIIFTRDFCKGVEKNLVNVIDGKINYLKMIKGKEDTTYQKFKSRFNYLQWKEKRNSNYKPCK